MSEPEALRRSRVLGGVDLVQSTPVVWMHVNLEFVRLSTTEARRWAAAIHAAAEHADRLALQLSEAPS
jgi:hypothetical protein